MTLRHYSDEEILGHYRPESHGEQWVIRSVQTGTLIGTHDGGEPRLFASRDLALDSACRGLRQQRAALNGVGVLDDD